MQYVQGKGDVGKGVSASGRSGQKVGQAIRLCSFLCFLSAGGFRDRHLSPYNRAPQKEDFLMAKKPTYEELEQRVQESFLFRVSSI